MIAQAKPIWESQLNNMSAKARRVLQRGDEVTANIVGLTRRNCVEDGLLQVLSPVHLIELNLPSLL